MTGNQKQKKRNWSGSNPNSKRLNSLKKAIAIAGVMESSNRWWTVEDLQSEYLKKVGSICERTLYRYLWVFEEVGIVEVKVIQGRKIKGHNPKGWRWLGWPPPIH